MLHLFLDTNILIHFIRFDQIDWNKLLQTKDPVKVVFAPVVIEELDKHKYSSTRKLSQRAKKVLPFIEKIMEDPAACKYLTHFIDRKPTDTTFLACRLDVKDADDNLIASIIEYITAIDKGDSVVYVTNDLGPKLKSKSLNIRTIRPNEKYLLSEPDELEQENSQLKKQLFELKNKTPDIQLFFSDDKMLLEVGRPHTLKSKDEIMEQELKDIQAKYPPLEYKESEHPFLFIDRFSLSIDQVEEYNEELEQFYNDYLDYLSSAYDRMYFESNSIPLQFILANKGTAPAIDIDIDLHFPDGFELLDKDDLPKLKKVPQPPYKPKNRFDIRIASPMANLNSLLNKQQGAPSINFSKSGPTIKKTNSYDVNFYVQSLKHHHHELLYLLYANFEDISLAKGFTSDYRLTAANIQQPVVGQLHVKFSN